MPSGAFPVRFLTAEMSIYDRERPLVEAFLSAAIWKFAGM
jgi:hypothetical protein